MQDTDLRFERFSDIRIEGFETHEVTEILQIEAKFTSPRIVSLSWRDDINSVLGYKWSCWRQKQNNLNSMIVSIKLTFVHSFMIINLPHSFN